MNTPVSFELAKLLKEKEIILNSINCYAEERLTNKSTGGDLYTGIYRLCTKSKFHKRYYFAPTIAEVVMWLYEKHGIWVIVKPYNDEELSQTLWESEMIEIANNYNDCYDYTFYHSPTEAYSAAIEYTLKNLIK